MKTLKFRPLRRDKKTGKVIVAAYTTWHKVKCADYNPFILEVDREYASMKSDELVYDHKGEDLFFPPMNPNDVPIFTWPFTGTSLEEIHRSNPYYGIKWQTDGNISLRMCGGDCQGTPTFTHHGENYLATAQNMGGGYCYDLSKYDRLTVGMVLNWYQFFLNNLHNAEIKTN